MKMIQNPQQQGIYLPILEQQVWDVSQLLT
jgi:hypothetical protein